MNTLLIGNILSFAGAAIMASVGLIKTKKNMLTAQNIQFTLMGIGNLVLGGFSGFIANVVSLLRNVFILKKDYTKAWKVFFLLLQIGVSALTMVFTGFRWIEILPIIANGSFTWFLDSKDPIFIKWVIFFTEFCWVFYDIDHLNFGSLFFDILTIITSFIGIQTLKKQAHQKEKH
jgi:hypothetical protein